MIEQNQGSHGPFFVFTAVAAVVAAAVWHLAACKVPHLSSTGCYRYVAEAKAISPCNLAIAMTTLLFGGDRRVTYFSN
jgi:hypothetical protein